jgi:hypothetical protein
MYYSNERALLLIFAIIIVLALLVGSCAVVASVAKRRGRSVVGWIIFSFFALPLSIILLLCLGETDEKRKERLEEEALIQWQVWDRQNRLKEKENEQKKQEEHRTIQEIQQNPGATINDRYRKK